MGCDIHTVTEIKTADGWKGAALKPQAFDWRCYGIFGFLADVRNYSRSPNPWPRREWPDDISDEAKELRERWDCDAHSFHWLTLEELKGYDYDQNFENRRTCRTVGNFTDGAALAEPGDGKQETLREFLGAGYFNELDRLGALGSEVRVLMCFDN
jgi:hypothetical protein